VGGCCPKRPGEAKFLPKHTREELESQRGRIRGKEQEEVTQGRQSLHKFGGVGAKPSNPEDVQEKGHIKKGSFHVRCKNRQLSVKKRGDEKKHR